MTTDDSQQRAIIASMRDQERAAREERAQFDQWSETDIAAIYTNPESERIIRGDSSWLSAADQAEVDRLMRDDDS